MWILRGKIFEMLQKYIKLKRISFSMPGHKNGRGLKGFGAEFDVTELDDTDSLHNPEGAVKKACENIAGIFGADMSLIMVNGSTGGIFTMLASVAKGGDKILVSRQSHMSVINACVTLGLCPVFFEHKISRRFSFAGEADISDIRRKLTDDIKAVVVTSPNYFGVVSDIRGISEAIKEYNIPLLVDEAHGAHFIAGDFLPGNAISLGADMVVESTHKTLNGLNQSAILHVKSGKVDLERVKTLSGFFQTSSPAYPIAASAENAVLEVAENGEGWKRTKELSDKIKESLLENTKIRIPSEKDGFFALDGTRLVFNFSEYDVTGYEVSGILREKYNIDIEMADRENIVLIATPSNSEEDFEVLEKAVRDICRNLKAAVEEKPVVALPEISGTDITMREAFYSDTEWVNIKESAGRISAATVTVYPPGVPVLVPGARITKESVEYLTGCGGRITGMTDERIKVIKDGEVHEGN